MSRIPFESPEFSPLDLEEFVVQFLNSGVCLPVDGPNGAEEKKVLNAVLYDTGGVDAKGVDVRAEVEGGEIWAFQCKLYTHGQRNRWTLSDSKEAVEKARRYSADRYFLVVIATNGCQPKAIDYVDENSNWHFWDSETLSALFLDRTKIETGIQILEPFFGKNAVTEIYQLLHDEVLVTGEEFFTRTTNPTHAFNHLYAIDWKAGLDGYA